MVFSLPKGRVKETKMSSSTKCKQQLLQEKMDELKTKMDNLTTEFNQLKLQINPFVPVATDIYKPIHNKNKTNS